MYDSKVEVALEQRAGRLALAEKCINVVDEVF